ncbi:hypothetical protein GGR51DRAFT_347373 [Nemania sp. FL0031]|nr:hypothetical protein GGR51DRAFT_347373 [Nemania sp. FL0031]
MSGSTGLDQVTYGVELEFLLAEAVRIKMTDDGEWVIRDPHPNDPRWLSAKIPEWEEQYLQERINNGRDPADMENPNGTFVDDQGINEFGLKLNPYARTKLTRVLRDGGLVVIKWPNIEINYSDYDYGKAVINDFSESENSDDEREDFLSNGELLYGFRSSYAYNPALTLNVNIEAALMKWQADYENYHTTNHLKIYRTRSEDIGFILDRCTMDGWEGRTERKFQHIQLLLKTRLEQRRTREKQNREDQRNQQVDPLHVPVPGLSNQYKAWTVTYDPSVDGNGMNASRYTNVDSVDPFNEYYWYGAEVVSPVLPLGDMRAEEQIITACRTLRDVFRIHKPMEVSTGFHVHLGHTRGWTLFQAKRFATLWYLTERTILTLHRRDRGNDEKWCAKMGSGSRLWRALYSSVQAERRSCADAINATNPPQEKLAYERQLEEVVPIDVVSFEQKAFLYYVWQYTTITDLNRGLGENNYCRPGVRWRIRGDQSSLDPPAWGTRPQPGTIEIRIMQGTLDADHINNWVKLLGRVVDVTRNLSNQDFRLRLAQFLGDPTREELLKILEVPDDVHRYWLARKRRDAQNEWWEYPDKDVVDWQQPFMINGHRATHDSSYD